MAGVVPAFDPLEHCVRELSPGGPAATVEQFDLQGAEERLGRGVVVGAGDLAHRPDEPGLTQSVPEQP